jgi:hypothetical protein
VPQLALDDVERDALVCEFDSVGVAQLVGREPPRGPATALLGVTSIYLQGIDNAEIIATVHARRAPMIPASTGLRI